jgi:hypothetical protein
MYSWELGGVGVGTALLTVLLITRLLTGRLVLSRGANVVAAVAGLFAYVALAFSSGTATVESGGALAVIWDQWLGVAPIILPLVAGLLGWVALRSFWRWCFLVSGVGLLLLPWLVLLLRYFLGSTTRG